MERCQECGLEIAGGFEGCQQLFREFHAREQAELAASYEQSRLLVDTYCVQHPDGYCASPKSFAAHITGLAYAIEGGGNIRGLQVLHEWLDRHPNLEKPVISRVAFDCTIGDVAKAKNQKEYQALLQRWSRSTWAAVAELQPIARKWMGEAFDRV
jgi:hypothetical protein